MFDFLPEGDSTHPEKPGRFGSVPFGLVEGFHNSSFLIRWQGRLCVGRETFEASGRRRTLNFRRKIPQGEAIPIDGHKGMFDGVLQFAYIAGPAIFHQSVEGILGDISYFPMKGLGMISHEMVNQQGNIFSSFSQRRKGNFEDMNPVIKIFPERAFGQKGF